MISTKRLRSIRQDAVAYNHRGIAQCLGTSKVATADFDKAIELQPKLAEAYNNRGIVLHKLGNYQLASKEFNLAAQLGMELAARHLQLLRDENPPGTGAFAPSKNEPRPR